MSSDCVSMEPGYKFSSENLFNRVKIQSERRKENKVNIHSNVNKRDNSFKILIAAVVFLLSIVAYASYNIATMDTSSQVQTNGVKGKEKQSETKTNERQ